MHVEIDTCENRGLELKLQWKSKKLRCLTRSQTTRRLNMSLIWYHSILLSTVSRYSRYGSPMSIGCYTAHCWKSIFDWFSRKRQKSSSQRSIIALSCPASVQNSMQRQLRIYLTVFNCKHRPIVAVLGPNNNFNDSDTLFWQFLDFSPFDFRSIWFLRRQMQGVKGILFEEALASALQLNWPFED